MRAAHVGSMTVFSRCSHGHSSHPTDVGTRHPGLGFDLLGAQIGALHGIGLRAPSPGGAKQRRGAAEARMDCRGGAIG